MIKDLEQFLQYRQEYKLSYKKTERSVEANAITVIATEQPLAGEELTYLDIKKT